MSIHKCQVHIVFPLAKQKLYQKKVQEIISMNSKSLSIRTPLVFFGKSM